MMTIISEMMIITKYSLPTIDFATRYSTLYSDFLPTRRCLVITSILSKIFFIQIV